MFPSIFPRLAAAAHSPPGASKHMPPPGAGTLHRFPAPGAYPFPMFPNTSKPLLPPKAYPIFGGHFPGGGGGGGVGNTAGNDSKGSPPQVPHLTRQQQLAPFHSPAAGLPQEAIYPSYEMIWAKHLGLSMYTENSYPPRCLLDAKGAREPAAKLNPLTNRVPAGIDGKASPREPAERMIHGHFSAFKPVATAAAALFKPYELLDKDRECGNLDHDGSGSEEEVNEGESDTENIDVDTVEEEGELMMGHRKTILHVDSHQASPFKEAKPPESPVAEADPVEANEGSLLSPAMPRPSSVGRCYVEAIPEVSKDMSGDAPRKCDDNDNCIQDEHEQDSNGEECGSEHGEGEHQIREEEEEEEEEELEDQIEEVLPKLEGLSRGDDFT